jgi:hypothetical protein
MPNSANVLTNLIKMKLGSIDIETLWEFFFTIICPLFICIVTYFTGHTEGAMQTLRELSKIPREERMQSLDDSFDLYKLDPLEFRHEHRALFDPPLEGLGGVMQSLRESEWTLPRRKFDEYQKLMRIIRVVLRREHDEKWPDQRYRCFEFIPAEQMKDVVEVGKDDSIKWQTRDCGVQT